MHTLLENYLDELANRLGPMPVARRNEELREVRQHLQNAVVVNQEFGQSEGEAAANAVEQFGSADELGERLVRAWRRARAISLSYFWGAVGCILCGLLLLNFAIGPYAIQISGLYENFIHSQMPDVGTSELWGYSLMFTAMIWAVVGLMTGLLLPKRAIDAARFGALAIGIEYVTGIAWNALLLHWFYPFHVFAFVAASKAAAALALIAGAWIGSRWRQERVHPIRRIIQVIGVTAMAYSFFMACCVLDGLHLAATQTDLLGNISNGVFSFAIGLLAFIMSGLRKRSQATSIRRATD